MKGQPVLVSIPMGNGSCSAIAGGCLPPEYDGTVREASQIVVVMSTLKALLLAGAPLCGTYGLLILDHAHKFFVLRSWRLYSTVPKMRAETSVQWAENGGFLYPTGPC